MLNCRAKIVKSVLFEIAIILPKQGNSLQELLLGLNVLLNLPTGCSKSSLSQCLFIGADTLSKDLVVLLPSTQTNLFPDRQLFGHLKSFGRARSSRGILLNRANISLSESAATNIATITQFHYYRDSVVAISPLRSLTKDHQHLNDIGVPAIAITEELHLTGNFLLVYVFRE